MVFNLFSFRSPLVATQKLGSPLCHFAKPNKDETVSLFSDLPFSDESTTYAATNDLVLYPKTNIRDLGVLVDPQLSWESHVAKITIQARQMSSWILNVFKTRAKEPMMLLFNSLVRSRCEYCCELWDRDNKTIREVEQIQRRFTSKIEGAENLNYWDRLKLFKISSLQRRREKQRIIHVWKIKNEVVRNDVGLNFEVNPRTSKLRAVVKPMPKIRGKLLSIYEDSFTIRAAKLYNRVPSNIRDEISLTTFKLKLNKWLFSFPDLPPINGYHPTKNSIIDHWTANDRYD